MKRPTHILVIRLSALGDVAMAIPVLRVLRATYPDVRITVLSKPRMAPLFAEIAQCNFVEADVYGAHKGFGLLKLAKHVKEMGVDAVADLHQVIRSKAITVYLSVQGITSAALDKGRADKKALIRRPETLRRLKSTHERYAEVFEELQLPIDLASYEPPPKKELTPDLHDAIGRHTKKMIGIAPFAAYSSKMYPLNLMKEVISHMNEGNRFKIVLFGGGKKEVEVFREWEAEYENVTNVAGKFAFKEELALISNLDLMLAMDSGNGHLAAIYGVPVLTLWGVTHPYLGFTPFRQPNDNQLIVNRDQYPLVPTSVYGNKYPPGYENAMESIPVATIVKKIEAIT